MSEQGLFIDIMRTVFPVVAVKKDNPGELAWPDSFGTAFCTSPGVFLTAAHVAREAMAVGEISLAGPRTTNLEPLGNAQVDGVEMWEDIDVAVLYVRAPATVLGDWLVHPVQLLTDVASFGYPHSFTPDLSGKQRIEVVFRGYKGYVVTTRSFDRLKGEPAIYEVSSPFPQGMSGAPLLWNHDDKLVVVGLVIGTSEVHYRGFDAQVGIAIAGHQIPMLKTASGRRLHELPGIRAATAIHVGAAADTDEEPNT